MDNERFRLFLLDARDNLLRGDLRDAIAIFNAQETNRLRRDYEELIDRDYIADPESDYPATDAFMAALAWEDKRHALASVLEKCQRRVSEDCAPWFAALPIDQYAHLARACGICEVRSIPFGVDWPLWIRGRPVHAACNGMPASLDERWATTLRYKD